MDTAWQYEIGDLGGGEVQRVIVRDTEGVEFITR